jgi:hypothetical protein
LHAESAKVRAPSVRMAGALLSIGNSKF